jgi:hypothetical protein
VKNLQNRLFQRLHAPISAPEPYGYPPARVGADRASFADAEVLGTWLFESTSRGFTKEQFLQLATAAKIYGGLREQEQLSGWDFSGRI